MRFGPYLGLAFALVLSGCAYAIVRGTTVNQTRADQVASGLERLRGLDFTSKVPIVVKTRDQAERILTAEIARDHSDRELQIGGESGAMVGLYPPGMDLKAQTLQLLRNQIAGFYDAHDKRMVLVQSSTDLGFWNGATEFVTHRDVVGQMLLAHELTHALQDQHFHIEKMLDHVDNNDDRTLALKAVAEGDATLAGFGYVAGNLDPSTIDLIVSNLANLPQAFAAQSPEVPVGLSAPMLFQYSAGTRFVAEAYRRGGWAAVNALYHNPPRSSQQIMQPELYFDRPSPPAKIDLSGYQDVLHGWTKADDDCYGEFLIKVILQRGMGKIPAVTGLVRNWDGDRMLVFSRGQKLTILWLIAFRDQRSAEEFSEAYGDVLNNLRGVHEPHRIDCHAAAVLVVIGDGAEQFATLAPAIWQASTITPMAPSKNKLPLHAADTSMPPAAFNG
ncbi:MAG: hypothetical protein ACREQ4_03585 [Candidatus Binataceae bacterium]